MENIKLELKRKDNILSKEELFDAEEAEEAVAPEQTETPPNEQQILYPESFLYESLNGVKIQLSSMSLDVAQLTKLANNFLKRNENSNQNKSNNGRSYTQWKKLKK